MLGFTAGVDVCVRVSDVMYFGTPAFDSDTVQPGGNTQAKTPTKKLPT